MYFIVVAAAFFVSFLIVIQLNTFAGDLNDYSDHDDCYYFCYSYCSDSIGALFDD